MGLMRRRSSNAGRKSVGRGRRVSAAVAVPIVLICGAVGFVLGSVYPPEMLFSRGQVAAKKAPAPTNVTATPAPVSPSHAATQAVQISPPAASAPSPTKQENAAPAPTPVPPTQAAGAAQQAEPLPPAQPTILNKSSADPAPTPEKALPAQAAPTPSKEAPQPRAESAEPVGSPAKEIKTTGRRSEQKRRAARSKRPQYADAPPAAPQQKGVISQIPIVGPVVGLVLPF